MTDAATTQKSTLVLPAAVSAEIVAEARRRAPAEACGLLVGSSAPSLRETLRQVPAKNLHPRPADRYRLAPADFLRAERAARAEALEVVGFWHSHPASPAVPSAVDRREAWEDTLYLIVSLAGESPGLRAWTLAAGRWLEAKVVATRPAERGVPA